MKRTLLIAATALALSAAIHPVPSYASDCETMAAAERATNDAYEAIAGDIDDHPVKEVDHFRLDVVKAQRDKVVRALELATTGLSQFNAYSAADCP